MRLHRTALPRLASTPSSPGAYQLRPPLASGLQVLRAIRRTGAPPPRGWVPAANGPRRDRQLGVLLLPDTHRPCTQSEGWAVFPGPTCSPPHSTPAFRTLPCPFPESASLPSIPSARSQHRPPGGRLVPSRPRSHPHCWPLAVAARTPGPLPCPSSGSIPCRESLPTPPFSLPGRHSWLPMRALPTKCPKPTGWGSRASFSCHPPPPPSRMLCLRLPSPCPLLGLLPQGGSDPGLPLIRVTPPLPPVSPFTCSAFSRRASRLLTTQLSPVVASSTPPRAGIF